VAGKLLLQNRELQTLDAEDIALRAGLWAKKIGNTL
jgi:hypothetical protein